MSKLRVAIIGCGRMGRERARTAQFCGAQIAAVYDLDHQRAVELGSSAEIMPAQPLALAAAIHRLLEDENLRKRLVAGELRIVKAHTPDEYFWSFMGLLEQVVTH